ncbi:MAG: hypothetical protein MJE68_26760, partial [Proteobacteria bacterium]|nr:hypothetical protein [Pseudomonadota bacterium]
IPSWPWPSKRQPQCNSVRNGLKRSSTSHTNPPTINKPIYTLIQSSLSQSKKKILSHDQFLVKLQRYASDAAGPLSFLLSELQADRPVQADKALQAMQSALCSSSVFFRLGNTDRPGRGVSW